MLKPHDYRSFPADTVLPIQTLSGQQSHITVTELKSPSIEHINTFGKTQLQDLLDSLENHPRPQVHQGL